MANAHEAARRHLSKTSIRQKRNYGQTAVERTFHLGGSVWLHNIRRSKELNPKFSWPWEGPYLMTSALSDVIFWFQESSRAKPKVIHADRLRSGDK